MGCEIYLPFFGGIRWISSLPSPKLAKCCLRIQFERILLVFFKIFWGMNDEGDGVFIGGG